jgi:hypothetical protein
VAQPLNAHRLFYQFLQKELYEQDIWLFQMFTSRLVVALGIWLHPSIYQRIPLLVPYAVRDPHSRGNKKLGLPDAWGSPNKDGYFRDDNSLIKGVPKPLQVKSPSTLYNKRKIGTGFVAAHVWQRFQDGERVARNPLTYSFVPNLVWLPSEVAALTDLHGAFVQGYTQALAVKIYRDQKVSSSLQPAVEKAWELLPVPENVPAQGLPDVDDLDFFMPTDRWMKNRLGIIATVKAALDAVTAGAAPVGKVVSVRYTQGLKQFPPSSAGPLRDHLAAFLNDS